jgi:cellulose biosynthesis protein BcsQ
MIVSFVQTKGGTGKSTLSMNTAFSTVVTNQFKSVALVELDPQGTLQSWWKNRCEENRDSGIVSFHHISSSQKEVVQDGITSIANHNELLILDIPGESTSRLHTKFACAFSDKVIIPMRTSTNDEAAFRDNLLPVMKEILKLNPEKRGTFQVLPSFTNPLSNSQKVIEYFHDILPEYIGCLPVVYPQRSIYENFNREGMFLIEFAESLRNNKKSYAQASKAVEDIEIIAKSIFDKAEKNNDST